MALADNIIEGVRPLWDRVEDDNFELADCLADLHTEILPTASASKQSLAGIFGVVGAEIDKLPDTEKGRVRYFKTKFVSELSYSLRAPKERLRTLRRVGLAWPPSEREGYPNLKYSHLRLCTKGEAPDHELAKVASETDASYQEIRAMKTGWSVYLVRAIANVTKALEDKELPYNQRCGLGDVLDELGWYVQTNGQYPVGITCQTKAEITERAFPVPFEQGLVININPEDETDETTN